MDLKPQIDNTSDFRSDTPPGKDPDTYSQTLLRYHKMLWSKPLPGGIPFDLVDTTPQVYLHHLSEAGEFWLSSDAVIPSFTRTYKIAHIIDQIPGNELDFFNSIGYTLIYDDDPVRVLTKSIDELERPIVRKRDRPSVKDF